MIRLFKKDMKLFIKDKRAVLLTFLLPVLLISLFAFAFGGIDKGDSKPAPVRLLITDMDKTHLTSQIISEFDSMKGVNVRTMDLEKARIAVTKGNYAGVLIFYKGFSDSAQKGRTLPVELQYDKAQQAQVGLLQPVFMHILAKYTIREGMNRGVENFLQTNYPGMSKALNEKIAKDVESKIEKAGNGPSPANTQLKMTSIVGDKKDSNLYLIQAIAGVAIMMLLFSITSLSAGLLEEKENGTLKRLLYSPIKPESILSGKMLTAFSISIVQLTVMFLFAWLAFGLDITKNIPALVVMVLSTGFAVSSIGIFLASVARTRSQAQGLGTIVILTMSAIGGSMIPLFVMPPIMQKIAVVSVNYWGIQGFYDIFWRGLPFLEIMPRIVVLLAIGTVFTAIALRLFRRNVGKLA